MFVRQDINSSFYDHLAPFGMRPEVWDTQRESNLPVSKVKLAIIVKGNSKAPFQ